MPQYIREQCRLEDFNYDNKSLVELNRYFDLLDHKSKEGQDNVKPPQTRTGDNLVPARSKGKAGDDNKLRASRSEYPCKVPMCRLGAAQDGRLSGS